MEDWRDMAPGQKRAYREGWLIACGLAADRLRARLDQVVRALCNAEWLMGARTYSAALRVRAGEYWRLMGELDGLRAAFGL